MINEIWKFSFKVEDDFAIQMPTGAKILSVQTQNETPCIWAQVDAGAEKQERKFVVYGTGQQIFPKPNVRLVYIGTFQLLGGSFVGHLFGQVDY